MFLPIGQECSLRLSDGAKEEVVGVVGNRDRSLIVLITPSSVYIYNAQPSVLLCSYHQPETEVAEKGEFVRAYWQFDSIALAITTKKSHLLIFTVTLDIEERSYCLKESEEGEQFRSRLLLSKEGLPSVFLQLNVVVNTTSPIACAAPNRDELLICGSNGFVHHLQWNGKFDNSSSNCSSFQLSKIPFAHDQLQSKPAFLPGNSTVFIRDIAFAPLTGGYSIVLSDGRAALLTSNDHKFLPNTLLGVWAGQLKDAVVTDTNHRFRSLLFGCTNGDVVAFHVDDLSGALHQTFRVTVAVKNGPELAGRLGAVRSLRVLPQNGAIAVVWETGGRRGRHAQQSLPNRSTSSSALDLSTSTATSSPSSTALTPLPPVYAVLSPMGAQWWCSLEGREDDRIDTDDADTYHSIDWGPEGYQLWLGGSRGASLMQMTRSAAFGNPYMEHSNRVVLISGQRIYISPLRSRESQASSPHSVWTAVDLRPEYIHANWPIRFASLDRDFGRTLVVAGSTGLSFCALSNQRWKIFGNESQERELHVTGGVFIWRGLMVGACSETAIKMYPIETRLDDRFSSKKETDARIVMSNMKGDILVTMDVESRLLMYTLQRIDRDGDREGFPRASIERTAEIRIGELVPHIACLVSVHLTVLTYDKAASAIFVPGVDTVLLNISGRLYTLSPKAVARDEAAFGEDEDNKFQLNQPATIASFVEQVWHDRAVETSTENAEDSSNTSPLHNALWINCGARGSHVWLPLLSGRTRSSTLSMANASTAGHHHDSFLSRRIMIPFDMEINPALIASSDCIATGVESMRNVYSTSLTLYTPHRNTEVFIHHLLRQLLKRNLGMFALDLAESFRYLPYFKHSLELLLHNVLEEEATSAEPIPDPLLPRVVAFIQEFPEFLKTIAHCARKTELALWPALFEVTGPPNDLFEVCLRDGQLETAASYLIILQNIESAAISLEQSANLLREALTSCSWQLARDLVRFAKSIDAEDMETSPARSPPPSIQGRRASRGSGNAAGKAAGAADELVLARFQAAGKVGRLRHSHSVSETTGKEGSSREGGVSRKDSSSRRVLKTQSSDLSPSSPHSPNSSAPNAMLERMNRLLHDHARGLLEEYCVRDLGCLCSHLEMDTPSLLASISTSSLCSPLPSVGSASMTTAAPVPNQASSPLRIADFALALQRVHSQFEWPYPVPSSRVVEQLAKRFAGIKSSASTACLSDVGSDVLPSLTPTSITSKKASKDEHSLVITPIDEVPTDQENGSINEEVIAVMEKITGPGAGYGIGCRDYRSGSPSSMRTSGGAAFDDVASINGGATGSLQMEPLLGPSDAIKGNEAREAQLRYMIGAFAEIAAMDWVFLLCVVLRDAAVARAALSVTAGRRAGVAAMQRLRFGCKQLIDWANLNCIGYVHILHVFDGHLGFICEAFGQLEQVVAAPPSRSTAQPMSTIATDNKLLRSRALRAAFSPGGAVRSTAVAHSDRPPGVTRARSRSVDRGTERTRRRQIEMGEEDAVSNVAVEQGTDCSIM